LPKVTQQIKKLNSFLLNHRKELTGIYFFNIFSAHSQIITQAAAIAFEIIFCVDKKINKKTLRENLFRI
jgi:hypothetical protein